MFTLENVQKDTPSFTTLTTRTRSKDMYARSKL